ncbi:MAG: hypothetical protein WCO79_03335 [bacterium]
MDTLSRLFGGDGKIKLMRLFLLNPDRQYTFDEVIAWTKLSKKVAETEIALLQKIGMISQEPIHSLPSAIAPSSVISKSGTKGKKKDKKEKKEKGFTLNQNFVYLKQLQSLIIDTVLLNEGDTVKRIAKAGKVKLIVVAGVFIQEWDSRADLLVVGDKIKEGALKTVIRKIELELGRELRYASLETPDFQYRLSIGDRLVRDILDYPHRIIFDKFGLKKGV